MTIWDTIKDWATTPIDVTANVPTWGEAWKTDPYLGKEGAGGWALETAGDVKDAVTSRLTNPFANLLPFNLIPDFGDMWEKLKRAGLSTAVILAIIYLIAKEK